jgi:hypothetical protein
MAQAAGSRTQRAGGPLALALAFQRIDGNASADTLPSAASSTCGYRRLDAALARPSATTSYKIEKRRATVDEDGQYSFAIAL